MTDTAQARDGVEAVDLFNARLGMRAPDRIQVRLVGEGGIARLCEVESALTDLWASGTAKELIWLNRDGRDTSDRLHLQAFAATGEVLCAATYRLADIGS